MEIITTHHHHHHRNSLENNNEKEEGTEEEESRAAEASSYPPVSSSSTTTTITSSSSSKRKFRLAIGDLRSRGRITNNCHSLLADVVNDKDDAFFDLVVMPQIPGGGDGADCCNKKCYRLDHSEDILMCKLSQELDGLFSECSHQLAQSTSLRERKELGLEECGSLTYGEIYFSSFCRILSSLPLLEEDDDDAGGGGNTIRGGKFYDLGSGVGRGVFAARFVHDFDVCVGIELLPRLHRAALGVKNQRYLSDRYQSLLAPEYRRVEFHCADILEYDWSDGDVVFAHSTCFHPSMMALLNQKAAQLKRGSYMMVLSEGIDCDDDGDDENEVLNENKNDTNNKESSLFRFVSCQKCQMTWGTSNIYIYKRR